MLGGRTGRDGTAGIFSPCPASDYSFQFSKYVCNSLEKMERKSWHRAARSYLNRTLNPKCFINKINNHSDVAGWEISHIFCISLCGRRRFGGENANCPSACTQAGAVVGTQRSLQRYPKPPSFRGLWVPLGSHTCTFCLIIQDYYIFLAGAWCRGHGDPLWGEVSLCSTRDPMPGAPRDAGLCWGAQHRGDTSRWCRGGFSKQELQERAEGGWILRGECQRCSDAPRNQRGICGVLGWDPTQGHPCAEVLRAVPVTSSPVTGLCPSTLLILTAHPVPHPGRRRSRCGWPGSLSPTGDTTRGRARTKVGVLASCLALRLIALIRAN
ncbi:uncharacterized protein LOC118177727 [Oxyura jamaicensis]|uniref:uncharacterized protein LOC118177727 n=1 Tax=Oxyura jamaicensis TaxID=8884 RepID=UPI0015A66A41|nr:uncharacterized protein LOC118177727 [Oxyura jamaicensis]